MTVNTSDITSGPYVGNGVADTFNYDFRVENKNQLIVYETDDAGIKTLLTVDTDYTVNDIGGDAGGTITRLAGALPSGYEWYIRSNYQATQLTSFSSQGAFFPEVHENAIDKLTFLIQQLGDRVGRSFRLPDSYSGGASAELPTPEALKFVRWSADASALENTFGTTSAVASDVSSTAGNVQADIDRRVVTFDTVADMVAATFLNVIASEKVRTLGYHAPGDGGGNNYQIVAAGTGTADGGSYIDLTGVSGQAKGLFTASVSVRQFGAKGDGTAIDTQAIAATVAYAIGNDIKTVLIPSGTYRIPAGAQTVNAYGIATHADPSFDVLGLYGVMVDSADGLTIIAEDAEFTTDYGSPFVFYRCKNSKFVGGSFSRTGTTQEQADNQSAAVTIVRSGNTRATGVNVDGLYRNLFCYRSVGSGFEDGCRSINARYYNFYCASTIDITLTGFTDIGDNSRQYMRKNYAIGGQYGNYFVENAECDYNQSFDCSPSGNSAAHIKTEQGNVRYHGNVVIESSVQNSGDIISGIIAVPPISLGADISNIEICGNFVSGCYQAIKASGVDGFAIRGNTVKDYYQTGIALVTDNVGGVDFNVKRGNVGGNTVLNMNDASTRTNTGNDKNAGFQLEKNAGLAFESVFVEGVFVDALGTNVTKTPSYGAYIESAEGEVDFGENGFLDTATNLLPSYVFKRPRTSRDVSFVSVGSTAVPQLIDTSYCYDGVVSLFNSNIMLPDAKAGMRVTFASSSSTSRVYLDGANSGATSTDTVYLGNGTPSSCQRNVQITGPQVFTMVCPSDNVWQVLHNGGANVILVV